MRTDLGGLARRGVFRMSPQYELVPIERLLDEPEAATRAGTQPMEAAVWLWPRPGTGLIAKTADADTARFLEDLSEPAPIPETGAPSPTQIAAMLLDSIIEVEHDGGFVSGPEAAALVLAPRPAAPSDNRIARLSRQAFDHALRLGVPDAHVLMSALYRFNTHPASPRALGSLGTEGDIVRMIQANKTLAQTLDRHWETDTTRSTGWVFWSPVARRAGNDFKLYVSPSPGCTAEVFETLVHTLAGERPPAFKAGRGAHGLLRPDKFVCYFPSVIDLKTVAARIMQALPGFDAQGVPFTAQLQGDGILSWGSDPLADGWGEPESWRLLLAKRLAATMAVWNASPTDAIDAWGFARLRIGLDGVDPDTWAPTSGFWG